MANPNAHVTATLKKRFSRQRDQLLGRPIFGKRHIDLQASTKKVGDDSQITSKSSEMKNVADQRSKSN
jgi:hypothetical protein